MFESFAERGAPERASLSETGWLDAFLRMRGRRGLTGVEGADGDARPPMCSGLGRGTPGRAFRGGGIGEPG